MALVIDILIALLIIVAIIVCVYLIQTLKKLTLTLMRVEEDVHELSEKTVPLLENLNEATEKVVKITNEAEKHVDDFNSTVQNVKDKIHSFTSEVSSSGSKPDFPAGNLIKILTGVSKGIAAFWSKYKKN